MPPTDARGLLETAEVRSRLAGLIPALTMGQQPAAVYTHTQLVKLGVDADLHVWAELFHGFFYNPDVPESREAYDVMVRFFDRRLGRPSSPTTLRAGPTWHARKEVRRST